MRLFIWDDVLEDYTAGIMFAVAEDVDAARVAVRAEWVRSHKYEVLPYVERDLAQEPKVYDLTEPVARAVSGGG